LTCAKNTVNRIAILHKGNFLKVGTFEEVFDMSSDNEQVRGFFNYNFTQ